MRIRTVDDRILGGKKRSGTATCNLLPCRVVLT